MTTLTDSILAQIRSLGYVVKVFTVNGTVEMHAVPLDCKSPPRWPGAMTGMGLTRNIVRRAFWRTPSGLI